MSTPHDPEDRPDQQYPAYPSTPHPEDAPGYGDTTSPYQGYAGYQEPTSQGRPTQGDGRVRPMEAVSWAFRTSFRNWPIWIIGGLLLMVVAVLASFLIEGAFGGFSGDLDYQSSPAYLVTQFLSMLVAQAVGIFIFHGALRQVDREKIGFRDFVDNVNFGPAFAVSLVLQIVAGILMAVFVTPLLLGGNEIANQQMATQDDQLALLGKVFAALMGVMLVALLVSPLTMFMVWFAVDRRASFAGAFGAGFRAGLRNYLPLLLFTFVAGVVTGILALVTFGLAFIVLAPVTVLVQALLFRQAAAGALPRS